MKKKEDTVIDQKGNELKSKKTNFFKKVWYSIAKLNKYIEMSLEGIGRALKYLLQITAIYVLIIACIGLYNTHINLNSFVKNIEDNLPDFRYSDGQVTLAETEENKVYTINDTNLNFGKVIIDLNAEDQNTILEYENTIKAAEETNNNGIIILKDKVIQVTELAEGIQGESTISLTYDEVMQQVFGKEDVQISKANLLQFLNGNGRTSIFIANFFAYFIAYFIIYISSGLIYALILGIIAYLSAKLTKINLTFSNSFCMSVYAFTLSNILNMIYFIVNYFSGITIKYFNMAYLVIAYVYLVIVLCLIKLKSAKKQEKTVENNKKEEKEKNNGQE